MHWGARIFACGGQLSSSRAFAGGIACVSGTLRGRPSTVAPVPLPKARTYKSANQNPQDTCTRAGLLQSLSPCLHPLCPHSTPSCPPLPPADLSAALHPAHPTAPPTCPLVVQLVLLPRCQPPIALILR